MKIVQTISDEQKERVVLLWLDGYGKKEIVESTGVSFWHVNTVIYKLEQATNGRSYYTETKEKLERAEEKLYQLAMRLATGDLQNPVEYETLLHCFASSDINNHSVYLGKV